MAVAGAGVLTHTFSSELLLGVTYRIVIAAVNDVHVSNHFDADGSANLLYSDELEIIVANSPAQVTGLNQPTDNYLKGTIRLKWDVPSTFATVGSAVSSYTVLKDVGSGVFYALEVVSGSTLEYMDTGLVAGQQYSYKVFATNVIGAGPESAVLIGTAGQEPGKISPLTVLTQSSTALAFQWDSSLIDDGGLAITGYLVSTDAGDYVYDTTVAVAAPATSYSYAVTQPGNEGTTFRFRIAAQNALGTGVYSDEIQLVATDAPAAPSLTLLGSSRTLEGFTLTFGKPASDGGAAIVGYLLYRDEGVTGSPFTLIFNGTGQPELVSFEVTGLASALTYSFRLYAANRIFASASPATLQLLVGTLPDRPANIRRVDRTFVTGELEIAWDAPSHSSGVSLAPYEVWIDDGAGDFSSSVAAVATPAADALAVTLTGLTTGTTYGIKMRAVNAIGTGEYSDVVYLVVADKPTAPAAPTAEAATRTTITLAWNAPTSDGQSPVTGYNVYMNALSIGDWQLVYVGQGYPTRQVYLVEGLEEGQAYRFMVSAHNLVGESTNSSETVVTASDFPAGPSQPQLVSSTSSQVVISWLPPTDNGGQSVTGYEVHHKLANAAESAWLAVAVISDINTLQYTHSGLSASHDV